jgi:hypothetical protein
MDIFDFADASPEAGAPRDNLGVAAFARTAKDGLASVLSRH